MIAIFEGFPRRCRDLIWTADFTTLDHVRRVEEEGLLRRDSGIEYELDEEWQIWCDQCITSQEALM